MGQEKPFCIEALDSAAHDRKGFQCNEPSLTRYLQTQANQDAKRRAGATYVLTEAGDAPPEQTTPQTILGYYTLTVSEIALDALPDDARKRLPRYQAVPAFLLGRLAVSSDAEGQGHGKRLLVDALYRAERASQDYGGAIMLVDALHAKAAGFYTDMGFTALSDPLRLFYPLHALPKLNA